MLPFEHVHLDEDKGEQPQGGIPEIEQVAGKTPVDRTAEKYGIEHELDQLGGAHDPIGKIAAQLQAHLHLQHDHHQYPVRGIDEIHPRQPLRRAQRLAVGEDAEVGDGIQRGAHCGAIDRTQRQVLVEIDQQGIAGFHQGAGVGGRQGRDLIQGNQLLVVADKRIAQCQVAQAAQAV